MKEEILREISRLESGKLQISRYREILSILLRNGFDNVVQALRVDPSIAGILGHAGIHLNQPVRPLSKNERYRVVLEELGPTFVKLGQILSNRPDMVPPDLMAELATLHSSVAPITTEEMEEVMEGEFGSDWKGRFAKFNEVPFASASMAQVHDGTLPDGTHVAIKIQRPGISRKIEADTKIMLHLGEVLNKHLPEAAALDLPTLVIELRDALRRELDFKGEAANLNRFAEDFRGEPTLFVPRTFPELTTQKVLTMDYVDGISIMDLDGPEWDKPLIARRGANLILRQIFELGCFHADPHPGNIRILPGNIICFLDFGMMGTITDRQRGHLCEIMLGIANDDPKRITRSLIELSRFKGDDATILEDRVTELIERYLRMSLRNLNLGELLESLMATIVDLKLKIPSHFHLLSKALMTVEGVARKLDPDFNMATTIEPFARELLKERLSPRRLIRQTYLAAMDTVMLVKDLPFEISEIITQLKRGKVRIIYDHRGLEPMVRSHEKLVDRIVFAIVLASLVIGSSLMVLSGVPPKWYGVPVIGLAGFVISGFIGFILLYRIGRNR
ncbi:MAG: hypothetical protein CVV64_15315 [Candidatus Wallbacteria bacterium HGW-Wallbacteria-1]|jgi:ubiquinone biosynthesis protein|uniref:Protein kinase domain-containing protein n=1 Tax=Candidatus Wallbacteria bacterium HGW-Wallbacteria-1 TaxID=2013854 RepID=A0A2N1PLF4_9BACT|nr:MAG: hypothetical protein CVV64_15315 [Candidatus Wallbacteria bacterium HGW-Wallbacteria-1]